MSRRTDLTRLPSSVIDQLPVIHASCSSRCRAGNSEPACTSNAPPVTCLIRLAIATPWRGCNSRVTQNQQVEACLEAARSSTSCVAYRHSISKSDTMPARDEDRVGSPVGACGCVLSGVERPSTRSSTPSCSSTSRSEIRVYVSAGSTEADARQARASEHAWTASIAGGLSGRARVAAARGLGARPAVQHSVESSIIQGSAPCTSCLLP